MIESYIKKVLQFIPFKDRKEVKLELEEMIYDTLGDDDSPENIKSTLLDLGDPSDLAISFSDQKSLIGPKYFGKYKELLLLVFKITLPIIFIMTFMANTVNAETGITIAELLKAFAEAIAESVGSLFYTFSIVTIVFMILEHTNTNVDYNSLDQILNQNYKVEYIERKIYFEGILTLIGSLIFLGFTLNPNLINTLLVQTTRPMTLINVDAFNKIVPFILVCIGLSVINGLIMLYQRTKTSLQLILDILISISSIVLISAVMMTQNLFSPDLVIFLNEFVSSLDTSIFTELFKGIPLILIGVFFIDIIYKGYQLYLGMLNRKKRLGTE